MVMADSAKELEDEFVNLYTTAVTNGQNTNLALEPPFKPKTLRALVRQNNILNQCVQAMEVNIDGSGHEFVPVDQDTVINEQELKIAKSFFDEPYPNKNWIAMRRALRVDMESIGYGFLEVLRTLDGTIAGVRHIESTTMRLVRLGAAVETKSKVMRGGQEVEFTSMERPRRFMQMINGFSRQYFKEFGNAQHLDRKTGAWSDKPLPPADQASELLVFGLDKDNSGPYWVPRWINQMPSVLGSRKAEEYNLEFFDSGGMPPAIIFIQGGQMVGDAATQLRTYLSAQNKKKGRAVVVELASNSGSLDSSGSVSARVERFGAEKAGDHMFGKYDEATEEHVRVGFRLPPIFIGKAQDYNYATAVVAYMVAEAQVFQPERSEFDEMINKTIIRGLGLKTLKFKSNPITLKSIEEKFKAIELVKDIVDGEGLVDDVNTTIGTDYKYKKPDPKPVANIDPHTGLPYDKPMPPQVPAKPEEQPGAMEQGKPVGGDAAGPHQGSPQGATSGKEPTKKSTIELLSLVRKYSQIKGVADTGWTGTEQEVQKVEIEVDALAGTDLQKFTQMFAEYARLNEDGH
jgi:PBSX family phage portal protein